MKKIFTGFLAVALVMVLFSGCDLIMGWIGGDSVTVDLVPGNLLFVGESDRETYGIGDSTRYAVDIWFASPQEFGADSYTLQVSTDDGVTWTNFDYYGDDLVTNDEGTTVGFPVAPTAPCWFRLLITGGEYDGQFSDAMEVPLLSEIDTQFSGWYLDFNATAVHSPNVGYGLEASCTVTEATSPYTGVAVTSENISYQWYRVNPVDYEDIELIAGETSAIYVTTAADRGHLIMVRMTGDGVTVGGFVQVITDEVVK